MHTQMSRHEGRWRLKAYLHPFLKSTVYGDKASAGHFVLLIRHTHWLEGWVCYRTFLDDLRRERPTEYEVLIVRKNDTEN
jgi:hypothetical protein